MLWTPGTPGPTPDPKKPIKPLAEQMESVNPCCMREDNLYVAEYDAGNRMVRRCRRCRRKHYTVKADLGGIFNGLHRAQQQRRERLRRGAAR
ncbi:MAG TPA: hypothetical protein VLZ09_08790 [Gaiellaceae bacterium]|nr:hypothetical protein [Gaiellaceae bacterium]